MKLSNDVLTAFSGQSRDGWVADTAHSVHESYADYYAAMQVEPADLEVIFQEVTRWAASHQVTGGRDVAKLCVVALSLGHRFWDDPRFKSYVSISLGNPDVARTKCAKLMSGSAQTWLGLLWQNDSRVGFASRLDGLVRQGLEPAEEHLRHAVHNHWHLFTDAQNLQLLSWLYKTLPQTERPSQRMALMACALVHGLAWWRDPQYKRLVDTIFGAGSDQTLASELNAIYQGMG